MDDRTTQTPQDNGHPRLMMALGGQAPEGTEPREFSLEPGVTVIGSAPGAHVQLPGLAGHHAEIRYREDGDEYVWGDLGTPTGSRVDGQPVHEHGLHTGDRIELGDWTLSYRREEYADHVRPEGGREGGEGSGHPRSM